MKRFCIFSIVLFLIGIYPIIAQDQIFLKNGGMFYATIISESPSVIRYTYPDRYGDMVFILHMSGVQSIKYVNERNFTDNQVSSSGGNNQRSSSLQLGTPTPFQQTINMMPAILIPLVGKSLKFELGGDTWIAKVNGENFMAGSCIFEETGNGYILKLKTSHVWTGAIEEVIDLLEKAGVPLGPVAASLRTAARLAARIAKWIPLNLSTLILDYSGNRLSFVRIER